ncbi:hypothetical protein C1646_688553 [Rhizophagus diaphanus]|nr:hypothetical protein C1646_688553 [Rhizophagus diaphanus] [Rhizophagus sp. MUCL 43196]
MVIRCQDHVLMIDIHFHPIGFFFTGSYRLMIFFFIFSSFFPVFFFKPTIVIFLHSVLIQIPKIIFKIFFLLFFQLKSKNNFFFF